MNFLNLRPVPFTRVRIEDGFWQPRIAVNRKVTARVCVDQCEKTHRIDNFRHAGGLSEGGFEGIYFNDSDPYKVLEGIAYMLMDGADPALESTADDIIDAICAAQQPDGYIGTFFTLTNPALRWTDMAYHEDYSLGHMVEGAVAYHQATGKDKWLNAAIRAVRQMMSVIGPGKKHWVTGHEEIELALVKLCEHTGEMDFLDFARWLVDERGHDHLEIPILGKEYPFFTPEYCQDDRPARSLERVTGHAVRAMYYYAAMADIARHTGDEELFRALERLWRSVVPANLYLTGGIGQSAYNEGFTRDWSLPNLTAYCETCASIGMALWNQRMGLLTGDTKYFDLVETEMYNGILPGVSLSGDRFFYVNPLSSVGEHHRRPWYDTSCCPTNIVRFIPSVGGYAYAVRDDMVYVNQYFAGSTRIDLEKGTLALRVSTRYPWEGEIVVDVGEGEGVLNLRVPGWCGLWRLEKNGDALPAEAKGGYARVSVKAGDRVVLSLGMLPRKVYPDPRVQENEGRVAFARGPVVYCAEGCDNPGLVPEHYPTRLSVPKDCEADERWEENLLGGVFTLRAGGVKLIPYCAWDNRAPGAMAVWLKESLR